MGQAEDWRITEVAVQSDLSEWSCLVCSCQRSSAEYKRKSSTAFQTHDWPVWVFFFHSGRKDIYWLIGLKWPWQKYDAQHRDLEMGRNLFRAGLFCPAILCHHSHQLGREKATHGYPQKLIDHDWPSLLSLLIISSSELDPMLDPRSYTGHRVSVPAPFQGEEEIEGCDLTKAVQPPWLWGCASKWPRKLKSLVNLVKKMLLTGEPLETYEVITYIFQRGR